MPAAAMRNNAAVMRAAGASKGRLNPKILSEAASTKDVFTDMRHHLFEFEEEVETIGRPGAMGALEHKAVHGLVNSMIMLNAVQMGLAVDVTGPGWNEVWEVFEQCFAIFFGLEMLVKVVILRLHYFGSHWTEPDLWNIFDFVIAWSSLIDVYLPLIEAAASRVPVDAPAAGGTSIVGLLRLLRLLRMMKLMRVVPQFRILFDGILKALHSMFWVSALCTFIVYMVSVACVVLIGGPDSGYGNWSDDPDVMMQKTSDEFNNYQYFGTVRRAMLSLFNFMVMAELDTIVRPLWERQPMMTLGLMLLSFVMMFGVLNILVGMIMDNVMQTVKDMDQESERKEKQKQALFTRELSDVLFEMDKDGDGGIVVAELENANSDHLQSIVDELNLPHRFSLEDLFTLIDQDAQGEVRREDFLEGMFRLLLNNDFQRDVMVQLRLSRLRQEVHNMHGEMKEGLEEFTRLLGADRARARKDASAPGGSPASMADARVATTPAQDALPERKAEGVECLSARDSVSSHLLLERISNDVRVLSDKISAGSLPSARGSAGPLPQPTSARDRGLEATAHDMIKSEWARVEQLWRETQRERVQAEEDRRVAAEEWQRVQSAELQSGRQLVAARQEWVRATDTVQRAVFERQRAQQDRAQHELLGQSETQRSPASLAAPSVWGSTPVRTLASREGSSTDLAAAAATAAVLQLIQDGPLPPLVWPRSDSRTRI